MAIKTRLRALLAVLWDALGPAQRHTERALNWWPVLISIGSVASLVTGLAGAVSDRFDAAWWIALALALLLVLVLRTAVSYYGTLHPAFPLHDVQFGRPLYFEDEDRYPKAVLAFDVSFTNREHARAVNLTFTLEWQREVEGQVLGPYTCMRVTSSDWSRSDDVLPRRVKVSPADDIANKAWFAADGIIGLTGSDLLDPILPDWIKLYVRIRDYVTGAEIQVPLDATPMFTDGKKVARPA